MPAPLTNPQKARLAILAREAFDARSVSVGGPDDGIDFDEWRRREVGAACGKFGLRACSQDDFLLVEAHFLRLAGRGPEADRAYIAAIGSDRRHLESNVFQACRRYDLRPAYAASLCRNIYKCEISQASAANLRNLARIIHRNGSRRARRAPAQDTPHYQPVKKLIYEKGPKQ